MNQSIKLLSVALLGTVMVASSAMAFPYAQNPKIEQHNLTAPQPIKVVSPELAARDEGSTVQVRLTIDELGQTSNIKVLRSTDTRLNRSIVKAVEQWRFEPATRDGKAVKVRAVMPISLSIEANS